MGGADNQGRFLADVPVAGGNLRVAKWGQGESVVLGIHGITGSSMQLAPVAAKEVHTRLLIAETPFCASPGVET